MLVYKLDFVIILTPRSLTVPDTYRYILLILLLRYDIYIINLNCIIL